MKKIIGIVTRVSAYLVLALIPAPVFLWTCAIECGDYTFIESIFGAVLAFALGVLMFIVAKGLEVVSNVCTK